MTKVQNQKSDSFFKFTQKGQITPASDLHRGYLSQHVHGRTQALQVCNLITPEYIIAANQCIIIPTQKPKTMAQRFPLLPFLVLCLCSAASIIAHQHEDSTTQTMEDFSGYPIHEPHSYIQNFASSSLSVDTESLQNQVRNRNLLMGSYFIAVGFHSLHSLTCLVFI